ncbi:MAG: isocitrate lyase/PEP mutase family protein [Desulfurococcaceae archaeon]
MLTSGAKAFRRLLEKDGSIVRPCVFDSLSAIIAERVGFEIVGTTGYGIAAVLIGQPDIGLVSFGEMLERVRTIINSVKIPVDVDADTGYGNPINTYWTVLNFARIGAAGVRIEDQVWPKKCGHMLGKRLISKEEMIQKIKAAIRARNEINPELVIGARTDARSVAGFDEALERAKAYAAAGADYVYVEGPQTLEEVKKLVKSVPVPLALNIIPGGRTPPFRIEDLKKIGVKYISVPMIALYAATKAMYEALKMLKEGHDIDTLKNLGVTWWEFAELIGLKKWRQLELELLSPEELKEMYGTTKLDEIVAREFEETTAKWKK